MVRACLSSDPSCTGIAQCDACARAINTRVLPKAMVAAGFNGNVQIAQRFFDAYAAAMNELQEQAPHDMAQAMRDATPDASPEPAPASEPENEEEEEVTEDEIASMGQIEDVVDEVPTDVPTMSRKKARLMARKAKLLKAKRAKRIEQKEDTHGSS